MMTMAGVTATAIVTVIITVMIAMTTIAATVTVITAEASLQSLSAARLRHPILMIPSRFMKSCV